MNFFMSVRSRQRSTRLSGTLRKSLTFNRRFCAPVSGSNPVYRLSSVLIPIDQVLHKKPLSKYVLKNHIRSIEREFMVIYETLGYPNSSLGELLTDLELFQDDKVQLWWANNELMRGKRLFEYVGKNEKTKIIVRLNA